MIGECTLFLNGLFAILEKEFSIKTIIQTNNAEEGLTEVKKNNPTIILIHDNEIYLPNIIQEILLIDKKAKVLVLLSKITEFSTIANIQAGATGIMSCNNGKEVFIKALNSILQGNTFFCSIASQYLVMGIKHNKKRISIEKSFDSLSNREKEIFFSLLTGRSVPEIANFYNISNKTISSHKTRIFSKFKIKSQIDLFKIGLKLGFYNQEEVLENIDLK